jgi:hypothetical protein
MLLAGAPLASAQDAKKVAVISIASYNEWIGDIGFIGGLAGHPDLSTTAETMVKMLANDLKGMDKTKPIGAVVSIGEEPQALIFVPVTDLKELLASLAGVSGQEAKDEGDGVFSVSVGPTKLFLKQKGGWAFLAQSPDHFADTPADPTTLLDGLHKQYDVAVRGYIQNIPAPMRQMAIDGLKEGAASGLGDPTDEDFEVRKKLVEKQVKQVEMVINEADEVTIGVKVDAKTKQTYADFTMKVVAGGTFAKQFAAMKDLKSNFAGFLLPDSAMGMNAAAVYNEAEAEELAANVEALKARAMKELDKDTSLGDKKKVVKEVVGELIDATIATIKDRRVDIGASLVLKPKALTFVAGSHTADGAAITAALKKLAALAEKEEGFPGVKWNADSHAGVSFHTISVDVPDDDARKVLGDKVDIVIGEGKKAIYLGFGTDCLATLKSTIDGSASKAGAAVKPMQMTIAVAPIIQFIASVQDDPMLEMIAAEAAKISGKDHINVTVTTIKNGQTARVEIESGVIELIGKAAGAASGGGAEF